MTSRDRYFLFLVTQGYFINKCEYFRRNICFEMICKNFFLIRRIFSTRLNEIVKYF